MKHLLARLLPLLAFFALATARAQPPADRYADLAAWSDKDVANAARFDADVAHAKDAPQLVAALRATALRQQQTTDELIALVLLHPELRHLPTLGLDDEGMHQWLRSHPHAETEMQQVPPAALKISQSMTRSISSLPKNQKAINANFQRDGHDPRVTAAVQKLTATLQDNRLRLMKTFS